MPHRFDNHCANDALSLMTAFQPTLSVVIPNYNHARYLPAALDAILSQSYPVAEIILIDDGSTDESRRVIEDYARRYPQIKNLPNDVNIGVVATLNRGLDLATGDLIYFGSADDAIRPGLFEKSVRMLQSHSKAALCSAIAQYVDANFIPFRLDPIPGVVSDHAVYFEPAEVLERLKRHGAWYTGNTAVWRRSIVVELGKFRTALHSFVDGFLFHVAALKYGACYLPEILGDFRVLPAAVSSELSNNAELFAKRMQYAETLMRTTFSDVFPSDFVDHFARTIKIRCATMTAVQMQQQTIISLEPHLGRSRIVRWGAKIQSHLMRAYFYFCLTKLPVHVVAKSILTRLTERIRQRLFRPRLDATLPFNFFVASAKTRNTLDAYQRRLDALPPPERLAERIILSSARTLLVFWLIALHAVLGIRALIVAATKCMRFILSPILRRRDVRGPLEASGYPTALNAPAANAKAANVPVSPRQAA